MNRFPSKPALAAKTKNGFPAFREATGKTIFIPQCPRFSGQYWYGIQYTSFSYHNPISSVNDAAAQA
jgi:hypothetical protein